MAGSSGEALPPSAEWHCFFCLCLVSHIMFVLSTVQRSLYDMEKQYHCMKLTRCIIIIIIH